MLWRLLIPVVAGIAYFAGLALHELTHVVMAKSLGANVVEIQAYPPVVVFDAESQAVDDLVRSSTIYGTLLMLVTYGLTIGRSSHSLSWHIVVIAFILGYFPRSASDWEPIYRAVGH